MVRLLFKIESVLPLGKRGEIRKELKTSIIEFSCPINDPWKTTSQECLYRLKHRVDQGTTNRRRDVLPCLPETILVPGKRILSQLRGST